MAADKLFRNIDVNPGDVYIHPEVRSRFTAQLRERTTFYARARNELTRISLDELEHLIHSGSARSRKYSDYEASLSAEQRDANARRIETMRTTLLAQGHAPELVESTIEESRHIPDSFFKGESRFSIAYRGDDIYWASLDAMPQSSEAASLCFVAATETYELIMNFFQEQEAMPRQKATRIARLLEEALLKKYPFQ